MLSALRTGLCRTYPQPITLNSVFKLLTIKTTVAGGLQHLNHMASSSCTHLSSLTAKKVINKYDTILLDCDGVIWGTDHVTRFENITKALIKLRENGKQLLFITNNCLHSKQSFFDKFKRFGFDVSDEEIFCVASAAAIYLKSVIGVQGSVYVIGSEAMGTELQALNIDYFGIGPDPDVVSRKIPDLLEMQFRDDVEAVLVGFDEYLCYNKLYKAASYLQNPNCHLVVTSEVEMGTTIAPNRYRPATGVIVKAVSAAVPERKCTVIGKPSPFFYDCIAQKFTNINKENIIIIGDSIKADIKFAKNVGIDSALVLSGASDLKSLFATRDEDRPTYYLESLDLLAGDI